MSIKVSPRWLLLNFWVFFPRWRLRSDIQLHINLYNSNQSVAFIVKYSDINRGGRLVRFSFCAYLVSLLICHKNDSHKDQSLALLSLNGHTTPSHFEIHFSRTVFHCLRCLCFQSLVSRRRKGDWSWCMWIHLQLLKPCSSYQNSVSQFYWFTV